MYDTISDFQSSTLADYGVHALTKLDTLQSILASVGTQANVRSLLLNLLRDQEWLCAVASNSYHHSNGFAKIVLAIPKNELFSLRLHIWDPSQQTNAFENVHSHPWSFSSRLLTGSYTIQEWCESESGIAQYEYLFSPPKSTERCGLSLSGKKELTKVFEATLRPSDQYVIEHDVLHRVISSREKVTSTLVFHGPRLHYPSRVFFSKPQMEAEVEIEVPRFTVSELASTIESYIAELDTYVPELTRT